MLLNRNTFIVCASVLAAVGCSRDAKPAESQASAERGDGPAVEEMNRVAATDPVMEPRAEETTGQTAAQTTGQNTGTTAGQNTGAVNTAGGSASAEACEPAVYFDTDSARLDDKSRERLNAVAECMKRREVDHATIVGQTDPSGTRQHNEKLGLERARAVAEYLRSRGVPDSDIRVQSKGELASAEQPVQLWPVERRAGVSVK
jgi:outer membrane protein OmpA-like peptidoglycan-associated protein